MEKRSQNSSTQHKVTKYGIKCSPWFYRVSPFTLIKIQDRKNFPKPLRNGAESMNFLNRFIELMTDDLIDNKEISLRVYGRELNAYCAPDTPERTRKVLTKTEMYLPTTNMKKTPVMVFESPGNMKSAGGKWKYLIKVNKEKYYRFFENVNNGKCKLRSASWNGEVEAMEI